MGGAISQSVNPMNALAIVKAVLGDDASAVRTVEGRPFYLSRLPDHFGGGYQLNSPPDAHGQSISFEIAPDGSMKTSSSTVEHKGLKSPEARPSAQEMLGILRSMQDTDRR